MFKKNTKLRSDKYKQFEVLHFESQNKSESLLVPTLETPSLLNKSRNV